jgi:hypothetical protein
MKQTIEQLKKTVVELKQYLERSLPLILIGAVLGYAFAQHLAAQRSNDVVGFATVEDMSFIISELKECREGSLSEGDGYE